VAAKTDLVLAFCIAVWPPDAAQVKVLPTGSI